MESIPLCYHWVGFHLIYLFFSELDFSGHFGGVSSFYPGKTRNVCLGLHSSKQYCQIATTINYKQQFLLICPLLAWIKRYSKGQRVSFSWKSQNNLNLGIEQYKHFQMDCVSTKEVRTQPSYKIYFPEKTFGKATKNRKQDPNMFELLSWDVDGLEKHSFKKNQRFQEPTEAYLNMIGRSPWTSEAHENFLDYHQHCIDANPQVLSKIDEYLENRQPAKEEKRSPNKQNKSKQRREDKKENRYQSQNYLSPKSPSVKVIPQDIGSPKNAHAYEQQKSMKRLKIVEDPIKTEPSLQRGQGKGYQIGQGKNYKAHIKTFEGQNRAMGQLLEKSRNQDQQISQQDQHKLIENFKQTTRWIPNSSFTTYFGKPPFENYGRGNTHPIDGGLVYGTYLYSHNVHPHRGKNKPKNIQSYPVALMKAKSQGNLIPAPPRTRPDFSADLLNKNLADTDHRSKIEPAHNNFMGGLDIEVPVLSQIQKFGGKKKSRAVTENA